MKCFCLTVIVVLSLLMDVNCNPVEEPDALSDEAKSFYSANETSPPPQGINPGYKHEFGPGGPHPPPTFKNGTHPQIKFRGSHPEKSQTDATEQETAEDTEGAPEAQAMVGESTEKKSPHSAEETSPPPHGIKAGYKHEFAPGGPHPPPTFENGTHPQIKFRGSHSAKPQTDATEQETAKVTEGAPEAQAMMEDEKPRLVHSNVRVMNSTKGEEHHNVKIHHTGQKNNAPDTETELPTTEPASGEVFETPETPENRERRCERGQQQVSSTTTA